MRTTRALVLLVAAGTIVLALAIGGCGGAESRLTKAQFINRGDAICKQAGQEQVELASHHPGEVVSGNFAAVTAVFVPPMERELRRLKALSPPEADEGRVRALLGKIEAGVEGAKADYLDLFVEETDPFAQADALARRYGLVACAESSHAVIEPQG